MADQSQTASLGPCESKSAGVQQPVSCVEREQIRKVAGAFSGPKSAQKQEAGDEEDEEDEQVDDEDEDLWEEQEDEDEEGVEELLWGGGEMGSRGLGPQDILAKRIQVEEVRMQSHSPTPSPKLPQKLSKSEVTWGKWWWVGGGITS